MIEDEPIDNSSEQEGVPPPTAVQPEPEPDKPEEQAEPEKSEPEAKPEEEDEGAKRMARMAHEARESKKLLRQAKAEIERLKSSMPQQPPQDEIEKQINERAEHLAREKLFTEQCNSVYKDGVKEFGPAFDNTVKELSEYAGIIPPVIIEAAYDTGQAAKVLHYLAQNPDEYDQVMNMPIQRMGVRIGKIADKLVHPAKAVSKAPAPIKPISGGSAAEVDLENMPIDQYMKYMDKHDLQRKGRI